MLNLYSNTRKDGIFMNRRANSSYFEGGSWAGGCTGSLGWLVDFRAQIPWSEPPRMAVKMGGWVCKISNFQDI